MTMPSTFVVIEAKAIVFCCSSVDEGIAFMEGRGGGVLYRLLYAPRVKPNRVQSGKIKNPQESKASAQRRAS